MYAIVTRRKANPSRSKETRERAQHDFFPILQRAPGFISFTLVEETEGVNAAIVIFASQADADAFREEGDRWGQVLDELGHDVESFGRGEVVVHLTANSQSGS